MGHELQEDSPMKGRGKDEDAGGLKLRREAQVSQASPRMASSYAYTTPGHTPLPLPKQGHKKPSCKQGHKRLCIVSLASRR